jgi:hypothetical protein
MAESLLLLLLLLMMLMVITTVTCLQAKTDLISYPDRADKSTGIRQGNGRSKYVLGSSGNSLYFYSINQEI